MGRDRTIRTLVILCITCIIAESLLYRFYLFHPQDVLLQSWEALFSWMPAPVLKQNAEPSEHTWLAEQKRLAGIDDTSENWRNDLIVGIPTVARRGHPDYLLQTVRSLVRVGKLNTSQIRILHSQPDKEHPRLDELLQQYNLTVVPQDPNKISPYYEIRKESSARAKEAALNDDLQRKKWRIQEAHDFIWLSRQLLSSQQQAKYIGFWQDDARLVDPLPSHLHLRLDATNSTRRILSLYSNHTPRKGRRYCFTTGGLFCGMVSMIFERSTLADFVEWLEPHYKENPIDWSLEEFLLERDYKVSLVSAVQHLGAISSGPKAYQGPIVPDNTAREDNLYFARQRPPPRDRILHRCTYKNGKGDDDYWSVPQDLSIGLVYNIPSNQLMQHTVFQLRNMDCLRLGQLHILPPTAAFDSQVFKVSSSLLVNQHQRKNQEIPVEGTLKVEKTESDGRPKQEKKVKKTKKVKTSSKKKGKPKKRTQRSPDSLLESLARPYHGYEPQAWTRISEFKYQGKNQEKDSTFATSRFLHVAQHLLRTTSSPLLGYWHDDIMPFAPVRWDILADTMLRSGEDNAAIVSLYAQDVLLGNKNTKTICGQTARCGFEAVIFTRNALRDFVGWTQNSNMTSPPPLELQLLKFAEERHWSIPFSPTRVTRLIGKEINDRLDAVL